MDKKKILLVDDDREVCQLLSILFGKNGYEVVVMNNGQEALFWLQQNTPDVVILDIMMPEMDGWETYDNIQKQFDGIPVIFLTASEAGEIAAHALRLGVVDYVRKPYHHDELLARVDALVHKPQPDTMFSNVTWNRLLNQRPTVSVVLPTFNEAENLPLVLPYFPHDWVDEVILVDGLSTDNTVEIAKRLLPSIKVIMETTPGKGAALQAGYKAAKGDVIIVLDCDGSHDPREIPRFVTALMHGADLVKGSRFAHGGGTTDMPRYRQFGNAVFVLMTNILFRATFTDLCYGYHAFWRYCLRSNNFPRAVGFEIDADLYLGALRDQLRIAEVPSFEGYRFFGFGKLQTIPDGWRVLKTILKHWVENLKSNNRSKPYIGFRGHLPERYPAMNPNQQSGRAVPVELIYHFSQELAGKTSLRERLMWLLQNIANMIGANSGSFLVLDSAGQMEDGVLAYSNQIHALTPGQSTEILQEGLAGWVVENGQPALVLSTLDDPRWMRRTVEVDKASRSAISVPFTLYDRVLGVMTVVREAPDQFNSNDFRLLSAIAVGLSLNSAGLLISQQRQKERDVGIFENESIAADWQKPNS